MWFHMTPPPMTPEIAHDLRVLRDRDAIDPTRHYRAGGAVGRPEFFHIGTVVEDKREFFSARVPRRERCATIVDELLRDERTRRYTKRRFVEIETQRGLGRRAHAKAIRQQRRRRPLPMLAKVV